MDNYTLTAPPDSEPITLEEAKTHLRVEQDYEDDDSYITSLIAAARRYTEERTGNIFHRQTWKLALDRFPCGAIVLRKRPVVDVNAISYIDGDGVLQTLNASLYQVDLNGFLARVAPAYGQSWPTTRCQMGAVEVSFVAGAADPAAGIPEYWKQGLLLLIGHYYENREDTVVGVNITTLPRGYEALVGLDRVMNV